MSDVTRILNAVGAGQPQAASELFPIVYEELRRLAAAKMATERVDHTLNATALVNEAFMRLVGDSAFQNRGHFFAAASEAMRRILVDHARGKSRDRRGGERMREFPDLNSLEVDGPADEVLALHEALEQFSVHDPVKAKLVEMRFFGGMTLEESANCLNISLSTADRAWRYARAWLYTAMSGDDSENS